VLSSIRWIRTNGIDVLNNVIVLLRIYTNMYSLEPFAIVVAARHMSVLLEIEDFLSIL
jgi:hypothetical protein